MGLKQDLNKMKFDKRIVGFNIQTGVVTEEEYNAYLQSLADETDKADTFGVEMDSDAVAGEASVEQAQPARSEY